MKKILLVSLSIILITACGQDDPQVNPEPSTPVDINVNQELEDELTVTEITEEDKQERAMVENDTDLFEERDQSETSLSDCNDFQDEGSKQSCRDQVLMDEALSEKNASKCNEITSEDIKEICLRESSNF